MGKRELVIAFAFIVVGVVAYQFTAPDPRGGERSFSLRRIFDHIRREIRSDSTSTAFTHAGTLPAPASVTELRIGASRIPVTITGENRSDIAYEMPVESTGPDQPTALDYAKRSVLKADDLGPALYLHVEFPPEGRRRATLTLRVPARLVVSIESASRVKVAGVAGVHLGNIGAETTIDHVPGPVTGVYRSGELTVTQVQSVNLTMSSGQARLLEVSGPVSLNGRNGECEITKPGGPVTVTAYNFQVTVTDPLGTVEINGEGGLIRVIAPTRDTKIDMRRAEVEVVLRAPVPLTVITTDEPLRVELDDATGIEIDAATSDGGKLLAADFGLEAQTIDRVSRVSHAFGAARARALLRNTRGEIVIGKRK